MKTVDRAGLRSLMERERARFVEEHPRSGELFERGKRSLLDRVLRRTHADRDVTAEDLRHCDGEDVFHGLRF